MSWAGKSKPRGRTLKEKGEDRRRYLTKKHRAKASRCMVTLSTLSYRFLDPAPLIITVLKLAPHEAIVIDHMSQTRRVAAEHGLKPPRSKGDSG